MSESKCMYCNSTALGPGCIYGPKGMHVHPNIGPGRCIYCGSYATGPGCVNSPFGGVHVMGVDYNTMIRETCTNGIVEGYLHKKLHTDFIDWPAFKIGLIDEKGRIIKQPTSIFEKTLLTPMDVYVLRLKRIMGENVKILNNTSYLMNENYDNLNAAQISRLYEKELDLKDKVQNLINQMNELIADSVNFGVNTKKIEQIIIECTLNSPNKH